MTNAIEKSALLIMDVQPGIIDRVADKEAYLERVKAAVAAAHDQKILVVYVVVGFRAGLPKISARNQSFSNLKSTISDTMIDPQPVIAATKADVVVTKRRVSAFSGSDLEVVLRAQGIGHLILAGIATSGVVLSTVREAADKDY